MVSRGELSDYLHDYLSVANFKDYAPNGLQVEGCQEIQHIVSGVSACHELLVKATKLNADAVIVHHGYFWKGEPYPVVGMKKRRIATLLQHDLNLFAYHLPLDCHPSLGNNACIAKLLGINNLQSHTVDGIDNLLWSGELDSALEFSQFEALLNEKFNRQPVSISGGRESDIKYVTFCTGAAQRYIDEAHELGADAYISGEVSEQTTHSARELGIDYFACGHHATERLGIQALGEHLASHFGLKHTFIDIPNPV